MLLLNHKCNENVPFFFEIQSDIKPKIVRSVTEDDECLVRRLLEEYHERSTPARAILLQQELISSVTQNIVDEIISSLPYIDSS
jgi:hypothetical protein